MKLTYVGIPLTGADFDQLVDVDDDRMSGLPTLKGTRFTVAQLFAELSYSSVVAELCGRYDLDEGVVGRLLWTLSTYFGRRAEGK